MKKSVILMLTLALVAMFAVGCSNKDEVVEIATAAPEVTVEATVEASAEATAEAPMPTEEADESTVTEEATEETTPDETSATEG